MLDLTLDLSTQTLDWLAHHPRARQFVRSVWDALTDMERTGQQPAAIAALRRVLIHHQPTSAGRCHTCRRWTSRHPPFPCLVWHQIRGELLGQFASGGRHRQPVTATTRDGAPLLGDSTGFSAGSGRRA
jgi:hypothetical protein